MPHLRVDDATETPAQVGRQSTIKKEIVACTSTMLDEHEELNCLGRPRRDIRSAHAIQHLRFGASWGGSWSGLYSERDLALWLRYFFSRHDAQAISAAKLRARSIRVTFAVIITYTDACTSAHARIGCVTCYQHCTYWATYIRFETNKRFHYMNK